VVLGESDPIAWRSAWKVILLSRFGGNGAGWDGRLEGMGIHPTKWPNNEKEGFAWYCKDTLVRTQDW
jgi:1-phosphatidylinositol phosphodiesterase